MSRWCGFCKVKIFLDVVCCSPEYKIFKLQVKRHGMLWVLYLKKYLLRVAV